MIVWTTVSKVVLWGFAERGWHEDLDQARLAWWKALFESVTVMVECGR